MLSAERNIQNFTMRKRNRSDSKNSKVELKELKQYSLRSKKETNLKYYSEKSICNNYNEIESCKTIQATEKDFVNPLSFFDSLWEENKTSTGVIKIIPPINWRKINKNIFKEIYFPKFMESQNKLVTRIQELNQLFSGKKFKFVKEMSLSEYKLQSENIENKLYGMKKFDVDKIEEDFWKFCHSKEEYKTHYAADVSHSTFLLKNDIKEIYDYLSKEKTWNLSTIYSIKDSLFQFLKDDSNQHISGLTQPWIYFGMLFSTFCWHVEDLYMYSLNYMHYGKPKIWYSIPHNEKNKLDEFIINKKINLKLNDPNILHRLILLVDPIELIENGIRVYKAIQHPGEIIFTLPKAYHAGFSCGFNISEAVNLATSKWIDLGIEACRDYSNDLSKMPVFPMEWLLHQNVKNVKNFKFNDASNNQILLSHLKRIIDSEKLLRKKLESHLTKQSIKFEKFTMNDKENYSKSECNICTKYGYFSYIKCDLCNSKKCINHLNLCNCTNSCVMIFYRNFEKILV